MFDALRQQGRAISAAVARLDSFLADVQAAHQAGRLLMDDVETARLLLDLDGLRERLQLRLERAISEHAPPLGPWPLPPATAAATERPQGGTVTAA